MSKEYISYYRRKVTAFYFSALALFPLIFEQKIIFMSVLRVAYITESTLHLGHSSLCRVLLLFVLAYILLTHHLKD